MPDTASITIVKRFTYRGLREEFSNKYHFTGSRPGDTAAWKTLADAIIAEERKMLSNKVYFVRAYGYEPSNELSVAQIDYEAAPLTPANGAIVGGQLAEQVWAQPESSLNIRWRTNERNSRKKWIYLRKYYHGLIVKSDGETVNDTALAAAKTFAAKMIDGTLPGNFRYCGPQGAAAGAWQVDPYAGTRELKRRGKRPSR